MILGRWSQEEDLLTRNFFVIVCCDNSAPCGKIYLWEIIIRLSINIHLPHRESHIYSSSRPGDVSGRIILRHWWRPCSLLLKKFLKLLRSCRRIIRKMSRSLLSMKTCSSQLFTSSTSHTHTQDEDRRKENNRFSRRKFRNEYLMRKVYRNDEFHLRWV